MEIYIVEDDMSVISVLQDIIEDNDLGIVCGTSEGQPADVDDILAKNPDMVLIDFLMPEKDGVQVMRELRERGCKAKCIMISQVAAKELIGKAYDAGIEFFISKPINIIEVKSVIRNVDEQIKNEKTLTNIKKMFMAEIADMPKEKKKDDGYGRKVLYILNRLGMSGEKGGGFDMKKNMGIGLSVCQTIVKAHGGRITAENRPEGGAQFRFYLPLKEEKEDEDQG